MSAKLSTSPQIPYGEITGEEDTSFRACWLLAFEGGSQRRYIGDDCLVKCLSGRERVCVVSLVSPSLQVTLAIMDI